jgi:hypothetical protein
MGGRRMRLRVGVVRLVMALCVLGVPILILLLSRQPGKPAQPGNEDLIGAVVAYVGTGLLTLFTNVVPKEM